MESDWPKLGDWVTITKSGAWGQFREGRVLRVDCIGTFTNAVTLGSMGEGGYGWATQDMYRRATPEEIARVQLASLGAEDAL